MLLIAAIAFLAMMAQDILCVLMCQAENRGKGWRAGALDALAWVCGLTTNHYALNALDGHSFELKALVVVFVTAANILGSKSGQWLGDKYFPDPRKAEFERLVAWAVSEGYAP